MHVKKIYADRELDEARTYKKFLLVRQEGSRQVKRNIDHYNLDVIIALGYRVQSQVATRFRRWATQRLHEYIQKGFAMDDERLKQGGNRYFRELLQRIRDIRSSERNFYQQVTDIYATATDYDPRSEMTKIFFATVQNKLHYAPFANQYLAFMGNNLIIQCIGNESHDNERLDSGISHKQAVEKAEKEFTIYRKREMEMLESDFDKEIKKLRDKSGNY